VGAEGSSIVRLTTPERASIYNATYGDKYPRSRLTVTHGKDGVTIDGMWWLGNDYRKKSDFYGAYPGNYLPRVMSLFPDAERVMHLFSGSLPEGDYVRVDSNPDSGAEYIFDGHTMSGWFAAEAFDLILADPPYSPQDAAHYGMPMIRRKVVVDECAKVLQPGGFLVWLDGCVPQWCKADFRCVGVIGLITSAGHRGRIITIYERQQALLERTDKDVRSVGSGGSRHEFGTAHGDE